MLVKVGPGVIPNDCTLPVILDKLHIQYELRMDLVLLKYPLTWKLMNDS